MKWNKLFKKELLYVLKFSGSAVFKYKVSLREDYG